MRQGTARCIDRAIQFSEKIGVFAGVSPNSLFQYAHRQQPRPRAKRWHGRVARRQRKRLRGNARIAHKLDLRGPAISVHTACSTSLVAVHEAVSALRNGECDVALAGAATITAPQKSGYIFSEGGMLSSDGFCRPFDAAASGTVFSDGGAMVALRRLDDAIANGDFVYAVIAGSAVNNDGANKMSFSAPSLEGQVDVLRQALSDAQLSPHEIDAIEAHGTGTPLGDPIEAGALKEAFGADPDFARNRCMLGSVKGNLGHLNAAAGMAGLFKSVLCLQRETLVPTANFKTLNPLLDLESSGFYVLDRAEPFARTSKPRRIGVSALGVGGTNAHVIVQEAPLPVRTSESRSTHALLLSAKSESSLQRLTSAMASKIDSAPLADIACSLHRGRDQYEFRRAIVLDENEAATLDAQEIERRASAITKIPSVTPEIAFVFPGQGSQYARMSAAIYTHQPVFRDAFDACADILLERSIDLRRLILESDSDESTALLQRTENAQPAIFAVSYALALTWKSWGIQPTALVGHSIGEFVAAVLSGVMALRDAMLLVATRGELMGALPEGEMLSVMADAADLDLPEAISIAALNAPRSTVLSGPSDAMKSFIARLDEQGIAHRSLRTSHAFHSGMMDPIVEPFAEHVRRIALRAPSIPIISSVRGRLLRDDEAIDPMYWARHLREPVRFADAIDALWENGEQILLECGPGTASAKLANRQRQRRPHHLALSSLGEAGNPDTEWKTMMQSASRLWQSGMRLDPVAFFAHEHRQSVPLPTYAFEPSKHWLAAPERASSLTNPDFDATRRVPAVTLKSVEESPVLMNAQDNAALARSIAEVFTETSGIDPSEFDASTAFLEMGFDSLLLTQISLNLRSRFGVDIKFKDLARTYNTPELLTRFIDENAPDDKKPATSQSSTSAVATPAMPNPSLPIGAQWPAQMPMQMPTQTAMPLTPPDATLQSLMAMQLQSIQTQIQMLMQFATGAGTSPGFIAAPPVAALAQAVPAATPTNTSPSKTAAKAAPADSPTKDPKAPKTFGAQARISKEAESVFTPRQKKSLESFQQAYIQKTRSSKAYAQENRGHLADPRVVTGFEPNLKEMVYPIVVERSKGSRLWDIDGNEYIDLTCGFGSGFMGHRPDYVVDAITDQMSRGFEIGPQHPLAGPTAKLLCELTKMDRAVFCNTGSEAVMGAMRLARTVTGKKTIVSFDGDYHGIFDEVIIRAGANGRAFPAAPGILPEAVSNATVLKYGDEESLRIIEERADEIAAVLVEPVQSRNPSLQPKEFVKKLRALTEKHGIALIFDEIVTGFRIGMGGAQEFYGIKADIATYGKVIGGGMPVGAIAGISKYMDALDGGAWQFGDASVPEVGVTYFAGTFVRHPLVLASTKATLEYLRDHGKNLIDAINQRAGNFVEQVNSNFEAEGLPISLKRFGSVIKITVDAPAPIDGLFFHWLILRGVHMWLGRGCFLSVAHSDEDIQQLASTFALVGREMTAAGFFEEKPKSEAINTETKPQPDARLGRDQNGNPAWFVPDPDRPGKYQQIKS
ncbi:MAG: aminotransferase class III-fold pyridoxal phosphate-dependent enzyme [Polyangiales bacterium]